MNITCGPDSDKKTFSITLPNKPSKLGVLVSGGIDSAVLYYLIHLTNRLAGNHHDIVPMTIMRKEGSRYFAQGVIDRIHQLLKLSHTAATLIGDNALPEEQQVKSAVLQAHAQGFDIVYCGVIVQLPQHMVNWQPIPSRESSRFKTPLQALNKSHIIDLCVMLDRTDLFAITHSCSILEQERCNQCNGCNERSWGFAQLSLVDPGML